MNFGTIATIGSIIAGLIALPTAGLPITGDIAAAGAEVSGMAEDEFAETPRTVSQSVSDDVMEKTVKTAFGTVTFESTSETFYSHLETPRRQVSVERQPDKERMSFTGGETQLRIKETPATIESTCKTPNGVIKRTTDEGDSTTEFSGVKRETVEEQCTAAREELQESMARIRRVAVNLGLVLPTVEISQINASKESILIRNNGSTSVEFDGWTVSDEGSNRFSDFGNITLGSGETVTVYSGEAGEPESCDASGAPDYERCWDASFVWNDDGETATLRNSDGEVVDTHTYN